MILTVTMNPSVDISYKLTYLKEDTVNRCTEYSKTAGGKGLNVTRVINQMGHPVKATGLLGGELGEFIKHQLDNQNISHDFSKIKGDSRNCIAVLHDEGKQTEILESGPIISKSEAHDFLTKFSELTKNVEVVTVSGSLPNGLNTYFYVDLFKKADKKTKIIFDTSGQSLLAVLNSDTKPYAIKPNFEEVQDIIERKIVIDSLDEKKRLLSHKLFDDIPLIVVSMGALGAFVKYKDIFYEVSIPKINVVNPVGSGDASVAGLAIALEKNLTIEDVMKTSMTLGILNAMETKTGWINPELFNYYYELIEVNRV